jgi:serine/threonine protein kinase
MFNIQEIRAGDEEVTEGKKVENYYYQVSDLVGKGNFSQVFKGIDKITHKPVAIKVVKNSSLTSTVAMQLLKN